MGEAIRASVGRGLAVICLASAAWAGLLAGRRIVARRGRAVGRPMPNRPTPRRPRTENAHLVDYLARERHGYLCAVARRSGTPEQAIEDVVQSALLDVLRSFPGPGETEHVTAYAVRCVQNQASKLRRRYVRKESRHVPTPERPRSDLLRTPQEIGLTDPSQPEPPEVAIGAEAAREARALIDSLPADQRAVLLLAAAGFDHEEIAKRTGLTLRGVRRRIQKANRRLRELQ